MPETSQELALTESRTLRAQYANRVDVLDKVKVLRLLPDGMHATIEQTATYYEVAADAVEWHIRTNRDELDSDGMTVLSGPRLSEFKAESGLRTRAASLTLLPRRAILRMGMLLRDSDVARQVRTYLLDSEAQQPVRALPDLTTPAGVLALAEQFTATARQLVDADEKIRELEPKAIAHDTYLSADKGDRLVREVAKLLGWREKDLRRFLIEERIIFHRQAPCGGHQYDVYAAHAHHFRPVERVVEHTWGSCAHYTLYVRPSGVDFIQKRVDRQRDSIRASIERSGQ